MPYLYILDREFFSFLNRKSTYLVCATSNTVITAENVCNRVTIQIIHLEHFSQHRNFLIFTFHYQVAY